MTTTIADLEEQIRKQEAAQPQPPPAPAPSQPDKTVFHVERDSLGEGMGGTIKPYRRFYGRPPKGMRLDKVEVEWDSQDDQKNSDVWLVPAGCDDVPGGEGSSDRLDDGRFLTFTPERYGTDAERALAGKKPLQRLSWEEHNYVGPDFDGTPSKEGE